MKNLFALSMGLLFLSASSFSHSVLAADPNPTTPTTPSAPTSSSEQEMEFPMKLDKCTSDVKEFCSDITPGKGRVLFCLKSHDDKVSQTCKDQIHEIMKEWKEFHQACKMDIQNLCKTVQPGEGRIMACLKQHQTELSTECKALVK
jgi:gas vesicle protein